MKLIFDMTLPLPPSVNKYWRSAVKNGRNQTYLSAEAKRFRASVIELVTVNRLRKYSDKRLSAKITIHAKDRRKIDIDNRLKSLLDALQKAGVYVDDSQFDKITLERGSIINGGCVEVKIWELGDD